MYIERYSVPSTTYGSADVVKEKIKEAKGIKSIVFGARDANPNRYATTILLIADEGAYLFDTANITMERTEREREVLGIFDVINSVEALDKAVYIPARTPSTNHLSAIEAAQVLNHFAVKRVFPDWRGFAAIFNEKFEMYPVDCYCSSRWEELSANL
ncbi:hypothetical protein [Shewanella baltica]|uniref:hypothetical protein n=1 Tax=Shewanella baltica TaxID=62322 RepID=UPI00217E3613|nr:hypothetical protein [Shewanella baltica]MCS6162411.1 hypothetical protein [Shewanella baltica]